MKSDNQHLEFLISQYVDGCLEGGSRKSVEQQLLHDPAARAIYAAQREVQDLLDDWGNRIPLIHWDEFDQNLASRLEKDVEEGRRVAALRRWMRPVAAAAALFIAAAVGYGWHAMSHRAAPGAPEVAGQVAAAPTTKSSVQFPELATPIRASRQQLSIDETQAVIGAGVPVDPTMVALSAPIEASAVESLTETLAIGMQSLEQDARLGRNSAGPNAVAVSGMPTTRKSEKDLDVNFP